ncbi:21651_t:CDS:2 [Gigaspora margarita]|uniref:21651_t:CDS:1 n=1 Tax=Gigaspora margarita TaxID=4874 RepID=A0ABN7V0W3_GIGMA|nr:21651_t:CDS:2 [Gigaspora margarita]
MSSDDDSKIEVNITDGVIKTVGAVSTAISNYVPLISSITNLIIEIISINETAQYNKKICSALLDRADIAHAAMKSLNRRKQENEENFKRQDYYNAFKRFETVLQKIRDFAADITNLQGYRKFVMATEVKDTFIKLTSEFDTAMKDLHFNMTLANDEQSKLDNISLKEDLNDMAEFLLKIDGGITDHNKKIDAILQEVLLIKLQVQSNSNQNESIPFLTGQIQATQIPPNEFEEPIRREGDRRGTKEPFVVRKLFRKTLEVACKPIKFQKDLDSQKFKMQLAILGILGEAPNVLKFYGISYIDNYSVMVSEWAELGNLKEVYEKFDIPWCKKVQLSLDICRGIAFLNSVNIFHHDIRCENIMITRTLDPKLTNFDYARMVTGKTTDISEHLTIVHWLAPEKMTPGGVKDGGYTHQSEIFSFGMLLWELCYEKIPYKDMNYEVIINFVLNGGREKLFISQEKLPNDKEIQKELMSIITKTVKYVKPDEYHGLLPNKSLDLNEPILPDCEEISFDTGIFNEIEKIMPLEEGIRLHMTENAENRKLAWECFIANAELGNPIAKYWQGYYLWQGFNGNKDLVTAKKLFKEAADDGIADAQFRYAFTLTDEAKTSKEKKKELLIYLRSAANKGCTNAESTIGEAYLKGSLGFRQDKILGIKYLKLAALKGNIKALELLKAENAK